MMMMIIIIMIIIIMMMILLLLLLISIEWYLAERRSALGFTRSTQMY